MVNDETKEKFSTKYNVNPITDCWEWTGALSDFGYGRICYKGKYYLAHRFSLMTQNIDPAGFFVCHHCDNPKCVNPAHLYLGDSKTNAADAVRRNRTTAGEKNASSKLSVADIEYIRKFGIISRQGGRNIGNVKELAEQFNVTSVTIRNVINKFTWR